MTQNAVLRRALFVYGPPLVLTLLLELTWQVLKRRVFISWTHLDGGEELMFRMAIFSFATLVLISVTMRLLHMPFLREVLGAKEERLLVSIALAGAAIFQLLYIGYSIASSHDVGYGWVLGYGIAWFLALIISAAWIAGIHALRRIAHHRTAAVSS